MFIMSNQPIYLSGGWTFGSRSSDKCPKDTQMIFIAYILILASVIAGFVLLFDKQSLMSKAITWVYLALVITVLHHYIVITSVREVLIPQNRIDCNDKPDQPHQSHSSSYLESLK